MAHSYSHLYGIPTTGLRFFTVYGPWGRPDMALFKFADRMLHNEPIEIYNHGKMQRDFTYVDDIVKGIINMLDKPSQPSPNWDPNSPDPATSSCNYRIYNIGNSAPSNLMSYIAALEAALGIEAKKQFMPLQPGDVVSTYADTTLLQNDFSYKPNTKIETGVEKFVKWYQNEYNSIKT